MPALDVETWLADGDAIALTLKSQDLPGLFTKTFDVPHGVFCLVKRHEGSPALAKPGERVTGTFQLLLVKDPVVSARIGEEALLTAEGLDARASAEVRFRVHDKPLDLEQLWTNLLADRTVLTKGDLLRHLATPLREAFLSFIRTRKAERLYFEDQREAFERHLATELAGPCFSAGVEFAGLVGPEFSVPTYDEMRKRDIDARVKAEELKQRQKLVELSEQVEKQEELKKQQVEEFRKILEAEGIVKELQAKGEIDRKRAEEQAKAYQSLVERIGGDEVKAMILLLEDEKTKARLIESLIERNMTDEQIKAKKHGDLEKKFDERIREMSVRLADFMKLKREEVTGPKTRRLLVVLGKQVLAFQPTTNVLPEAPKEIHDTGEEGGPDDLGYLRSVRVADLPDRPGAILAGAQRGVYVLHGPKRAAYSYPKAPEGKGGVNSVAYFGGYLYATHSEVGVWRWPIERMAVGSRGEPMFAPLTHGSETTRGAQTTLDGRLYFATENHIYEADLKTGSAEPRDFRGCPDSITALAIGDGTVLAGTKGGEIYIWKGSDPAAPVRLKLRSSNPIYMLRLYPVDGGEFLLVGAKAFSVTASRLGSDIYNDYRAPEEIRWVDGAADMIYGVSRSGYTVHAWEVGKYDEPVLKIRVADRIQDVCMMREESGQP